MQCPRCGLVNADTAEVCDCGHRFGAAPDQQAVPSGAGAPGWGGRAVPYTQMASLADRLLGQLIDACIAFGAAILGMAPLLLSFDLSFFSVGLGYLAGLFYLLFADGFQGQSIGKRVMGTAVVDAATGRPCTYAKSCLRNLLLLVLGFIDWIFIFGSRRQRLGDKAADTLVVKVPGR
jgi:uncharacterized RDD family membrane protein YckC